MLKIFIVENDDNQRENLEKVIMKTIFKKNLDAKIVYSNKSASALIEELSKTKNISSHLYFLDIDLDDGEDGLSLAREIREYDYMGNIVFVTGHEEYARKTLEYNVKPLDYIVKGVVADIKSNVEKCMGIAYDEMLNYPSLENKKPEVLAIKKGTSIVRIPVNEIFYIEAWDRKIIIYYNNDRLEFYGKLKEVEQDISNKKLNNFYKCHRSYLINTEYVTHVEGNFVYLSNDMEVPVSRSEIKKLKKIIERV